jgi:hypothetical protein
MNIENQKVASEILNRLDRLEKVVFGAQTRKHASVESKKSRSAGLPDHILSLRDSGFLSLPKTSGEVHERLQSKYPCEANRVAMALLRLQRRRELRKASKVVDGKKQAAYVW